MLPFLFDIGSPVGTVQNPIVQDLQVPPKASIPKIMSDHEIRTHVLDVYGSQKRFNVIRLQKKVVEGMPKFSTYPSEKFFGLNVIGSNHIKEVCHTFSAYYLIAVFS